MANKAITPEDAATMQSAENMALGHIHKGGPAAVMQSATSVNRNRSLHQVTGDQHFTVSEPKLPVVGQYVHPTSAPVSLKSGGDDLVTIGEALEAAALSAAEKPVEQSDAAAIQAAEVRATGRMQVIPGGVTAKAQGSACQNARTRRDKEKTKLGDVLTDVSSLLPKDKVVTREDAEGVMGAEIRNQPELATYPGGVAASMAAAARLNQNK
ncbi:putative Late embryogenesis abundant protein, SMP subgroup [Helianthus annuus]|uniref:Late embryogenesis abundant protein, SMP subgroup n=1 Tax=Helianthus annuus TaxID=4232 RepID=A0A9K3IZG3_HELAN|nr:putative Late embryogenesis abundant protein, SMP subgroup [Helianthus annuus]KAJ0577138.1 putative Late embryogenesis abundant protein, SMP subgroup [Helianthus annuus]KAJ0584677.1 putative Late embryogenesis abundant protein, SMP subgroup [Helianthus annuus]KAJ0750344.1 putative Late embryogenesis abundant protein, SMP subgroup [Helianthus annuus]KAJ0919080.1 putative Late embryogenesis abundant protein, SMP subgroup [Helianthus annuus]